MMRLSGKQPLQRGRCSAGIDLLFERAALEVFYEPRLNKAHPGSDIRARSTVPVTDSVK